MKAFCTGVPARTPFWHALGAFFLLLAEASISQRINELTNQCSMQRLGGVYVIPTHVTMASRGILSPTGRPKSDRTDRRRIPVGRRLFSAPTISSDVARKQTWSREEDRALVEFVLFHSDPAVWPSHSKKSKFWTEAATFVQQRSKASVQRNGSSLILIATFLIQN